MVPSPACTFQLGVKRSGMYSNKNILISSQSSYFENKQARNAAIVKAMEEGFNKKRREDEGNIGVARTPDRK